jgi:ABC-type transport system substrate-binding protein
MRTVSWQPLFPRLYGLVGSVALVVCLLTLSAQAQEDRPCGKYGGVLRTHAGEDLVHFDPHLQTTVRTQQRVGGSYNRLFRFSFYEKDKVLPDLVERWEVSNDGTSYT